MARIKMLSFTIVLVLVLISLLASCAPAATTQAPTSQAQTSSTPVTTTAAPSATTAEPTTTAAGPAKPEGELVVALPGFDLEDFLPWHFGLSSTQMGMLMYDLLIYWNEVDRQFIPGLAESWEVAPDAMTLTYHLRKGVQFSDGWGELTSADVKYNFEMQASKWSTGKVSQTRRIESMETPDPYTLVVHFKTPYPSFYMDLSLGNSGICQGIVPKKYLETVGEEVAMTKPIGSGPYRLVEGVSGEYFKFEAVDSHWRIVPEFKNITLRNIPETSTAVAMLKTKEMDMAAIPAEQMADLKASGLSPKPPLWVVV